MVSVATGRGGPAPFSLIPDLPPSIGTSASHRADISGDDDDSGKALSQGITHPTGGEAPSVDWGSGRWQFLAGWSPKRVTIES